MSSFSFYSLFYSLLHSLIFLETFAWPRTSFYYLEAIVQEHPELWIEKKRANKMTTNHIYFCFSPHFWLRINLDCLLNGDYINFNSGFSRMKSRSSRTTLWCLIVIIRKCFVSRCPNMYTARYGKTVRAWLERAALRLSNALARARAQAKKPSAALTANRSRARWTKANHMCQNRGPFIKFNNALKPKLKVEIQVKINADLNSTKQ